MIEPPDTDLAAAPETVQAWVAHLLDKIALKDARESAATPSMFAAANMIRMQSTSLDVYADEVIALRAELDALRASLPQIRADERERAAQIVVECASMCLVMGDHDGKNTCLSVANAIRAMEDPS